MGDPDNRPSPDEILQAIRAEEREEKLGQLKVFFGMAAGVGKTYEMLSEAQQRLKEGVDLVIATVRTHGRPETERLLRGLPTIPEQWVEYRDLMFEEMDLDALLKRKPELAIVDELAHTNVPGSRHAKRWQDVIEILDAGIDVYTTLNVQHVESLNDIVEGFTGIRVRETVPDLILERAASIELIDITPAELLKRLEEGKVYLGDHSKLAAKNFFKKENLTALREIALRMTAERVEHELHTIFRGAGWSGQELLMTTIDPSPATERRLRATKRLADRLDGPWIAIYVDRKRRMSEQEQVAVNRSVDLARELGAEVITTYDIDPIDALTRIAEQRRVSRIVLSPPRRGLFGWRDPFAHLKRLNQQFDLMIVKEAEGERRLPSLFGIRLRAGWTEYAAALLACALFNLIGVLTVHSIGYRSVGFIFLFGILFLSLFVGIGPIFLAAIASAISWNLVFIPPQGTLAISDPEDAIFLLFYFALAAMMGIATSRTRLQGRYLRRREELMERLYRIEQDIAQAESFQELRRSLSQRLEEYLPGQFDIMIRGADRKLILDSPLPLLTRERERQCALWAFQNRHIAGHSTDTLPACEGVYFPIFVVTAPVGVLVYRSNKGLTLSIEESRFLQTITHHLGVHVERYAVEEGVRREEYAEQVRRMHHSFFHSLNRSLYAPLDELTKINKQIRQLRVESKDVELLRKADSLVTHIKIAIDNIATMSKFDAGLVSLERKREGEHSIKALVDAVLDALEPVAVNRKIVRRVPPLHVTLPAIFDFHLLSLLLKNSVMNALEHTQGDAPISVGVEVVQDGLRLYVSDTGSGLPKEVIAILTDRSTQSATATKRLGLGLAIVKAIADFYRGRIEVTTSSKKGTLFSVLLPY